MAGSQSESLKSRTYVGLIFAQFTNSFNDQASHIIGNFFACDMLIAYANVRGVDEKLLVAIVTLCFIAPLLIFSPFAGIIADKYSKRTVIVIMKSLESSFMVLGAVALFLPRLSAWFPEATRSLGIASALLMILVVFLMGLQTAFLVPAKYGIMPEILHPVVLSRGNGILEGTTFVAQLAGTSVGGILYTLLKSPDDLTNGFRHSNVWIAGVVLLLLAIAGLVGAWMMGPVPAAAPHRKLTWNWLSPLRESFGVLARSKPLALAVVGIAFAAFMTLYSRQTLLYDGETLKQLSLARQELAEMTERAVQHDPGDPGALVEISPVGISESQRAELRVSMLIAMVGLGIGVGSLLAGYLSGSKLELGLVPIGGTALCAITALLALLLRHPPAVIVCLVLVGLCAGLYVVPMYTMLQHRAPKEQKGNVVAASNFVNVAGGVLAVAVFYFISLTGEAILGPLPSHEQAAASIASMESYVSELSRRLWIPRLLFAGASVMTLGMLIMICRQLPDFFTRALLYLFSQRAYHLRVDGLHHLPQDGPVVLVTNSSRFDNCVHVISATDRYVHFYLPKVEGEDETSFLRLLSRLTSTTTLSSDWADPVALESALATLNNGDMVGLVLESDESSREFSEFFLTLEDRCEAPIIPVWCDVHRKTGPEDPEGPHRRQARIIFGDALPPHADPTGIRDSLRQLDQPPEPRRQQSVVPS